MKFNAPKQKNKFLILTTITLLFVAILTISTIATATVSDVAKRTGYHSFLYTDTIQNMYGSGAISVEGGLDVDGDINIKNDLYVDGKVGIGTTSPDYKLDVNGDVGASGYFHTSDISLKENVEPISGALDKVLGLEGVSFNWKENEEPSIGLIAQDVEKILPEIISGEDGSKSVQYANLVAVLIEAVKEQQVMIDELREEVEALK